MSEEYAPLTTLDRALRNWWIIVICVVLGGGIGWIIHSFRLPVYEAHARLSTNIDFTRMGLLTDIEQDQVVGMVGDVITSPAVFEAVASAARDEGIHVDATTLKSSFFPGRAFYVWELRVRHENPEIAARLANLWAEQAFSALVDAHVHSVMAASLQRYMDALESCLEQMVVAEPVNVQCSSWRLDELQDELEKASIAVKEEKLASQGIFPGTTFALTEKAETPVKPVLYGRNQLMLTGGLVGFILAVWLIHLGWIDRLIGKLN
ncbi:MAG: hypothetical protein WHV66_01745 [Anaerolineales bacterium]